MNINWRNTNKAISFWGKIHNTKKRIITKDKNKKKLRIRSKVNTSVITGEFVNKYFCGDIKCASVDYLW